MSEKTETPAENLTRKMALAAKIGGDFAIIEAAQKEVDGLEVAAATDRAALVKEWGPGPHAMPLPDGRTMIATFRKAGPKFSVSAVDKSTIPGL